MEMVNMSEELTTIPLPLIEKVRNHLDENITVNESRPDTSELVG